MLIVIDESSDKFELVPFEILVSKILSSEEFFKRNLSTIALYGNWGSGKTSTMKSLKSKLSTTSQTQCEFFEAWKYVKDDNLPLSLVSYLSKDIKESEFVEVLVVMGAFLKGFTKGVKISLTANPFISIEPSKALNEAERKFEKIQDAKIQSFYKLEEEFKKTSSR